MRYRPPKGEHEEHSIGQIAQDAYASPNWRGSGYMAARKAICTPSTGAQPHLGYMQGKGGMATATLGAC